MKCLKHVEVRNETRLPFPNDQKPKTLFRLIGLPMEIYRQVRLNSVQIKNQCLFSTFYDYLLLLAVCRWMGWIGLELPMLRCLFRFGDVLRDGEEKHLSRPIKSKLSAECRRDRVVSAVTWTGLDISGKKRTEANKRIGSYFSGICRALNIAKFTMP